MLTGTLRRSSTIAATRRHTCFASCLRSFSTEISKVWISDVFPPPRPTLSTIPAATRHLFDLRSFSTETPKEWINDAFKNTKDVPPTGKVYPRAFSGSLPGSTKLDIPKYHLHCKSNHNNTIITFSNHAGNIIAWQSGGRCQFKGANRASYEAGYQSAVRIFEVIEKLANAKDFTIALFFKGFGQGREALKTALLAVEGQNIRPLICSVTDRTAIKIGGTRSKKTRRL